MENAHLQTTEASALSKHHFNPNADLFSGFATNSATAAKHQSKFTGTDNPRELRVIHFLLNRPMPRKQFDRSVGCSNGPDLVFRMRQKGLEIPCIKIDAIDRDGKPCRPGVFYLTDSDRKKINRWLTSRQNGGIDLTLAGLVAMACVCVVLLAGVL